VNLREKRWDQWAAFAAAVVIVLFLYFYAKSGR